MGSKNQEEVVFGDEDWMFDEMLPDFDVSAFICVLVSFFELF
jgi:hypothetical protein